MNCPWIKRTNYFTFRFWFWVACSRHKKTVC